MTGTLTQTDELTEKRTEIIKVIAADFERTEFARSQLNAHMYYNDMGHLIEEDDDEEEDTLQTTTGLLNKIAEEDGYLHKTEQGGTNRFIIDTGADEDEGDQVTAVTPNEIAQLVAQIADRHGVTINIPEDRLPEWGFVCNRVNGTVGSNVLRIASNPNRYRLTTEGLELVQEELL
ncbi:hypothetical protein [Natrialba asiatica]|uniref:Uncharacterized protein n=1 Tax=Natrialba asiatica (strain ATCC 700177 / DSM 12278 / JCM 9576 / FERM P-10747 / NBRC 102637 / 172P1) TaxID=29540 RepID=M0AL64_NATA1|nr:hypothetical protein [Natrialba asiatica]ELY99460.1 hypothetical protein C481_14543 [Natrialba asiatica DSM 12278]